MVYMHGAKPTESPGRYGPHIAVMRDMNWGWDQLCSAPADLVDEILAHISYERKWEKKRAEIDRARAKNAS